MHRHGRLKLSLPRRLLVTVAVLIAFSLRGDSGGLTPLAFVVMGLLPMLAAAPVSQR